MNPAFYHYGSKDSFSKSHGFFSKSDITSSNPVNKLFSISMDYSLLTLLPSSFLARIVKDYSSEIGELSIRIFLEKA